MYIDSGSCGACAPYNGGWGFDYSGLPTGGDATSTPGALLGAALAAPLTWTADQDHSWPGLQPEARLGVGLGIYVFPEMDPVLGGLPGGFGQDLSNARNPVEGDGTWLMQEGVIDTSGWRPSEYHFELNPTLGAVFSPTLDYSQDQGGGFRISVEEQDMAGDTFTFRLLSSADCDLDDDDDVDLNDFATFALCFFGANVTTPPPGCPSGQFDASDFDEDGDVDFNDLGTFVLMFTG
jgi:hypothetical protein